MKMSLLVCVYIFARDKITNFLRQFLGISKVSEFLKRSETCYSLVSK